jgi:PBP1b-binding outer membrane lipoprotein LpoB
MKKIILSIIVTAVVFIACNSNSDKTKEMTPVKNTTTDTTPKPADMKPVAEQLYSCPMHPEVIGKKDEKCSKCGMKLTVPVKN